jgi:anti-sigma regulatory factor (Ser/Thr protein kinase)
MPDSHARTARREADFSVSLAPDAHAPSRARRELSEHLPGGLPPSLVDDILLLTTELVTNGVRHSPAGDAGTVDVSMFLRSDRIRVEVRDPGSGFAHVPYRPGTLSEGGRGLFLVEVIADEWGMGGSDGTVVWYELDVERDDDPRGGDRVESTGQDLTASAALDQVPAASPPSESQLASDADELAAELRALGSATESVESRARDIEAALARLSGSLKAGAEALRTREDVTTRTGSGPLEPA